MAAVNAVCNASPLITLAKAGLLDVLPKLFSRVVVPKAVVDEIMQGPEDDPMRANVSVLSWLEAVNLDPPLTALASMHIGAGEAEVLEWAFLHKEDNYIAILDDRAARRAGKALGVTVIGTLGVLASATIRGLMPSFDEAVGCIVKAGLYVDERIISAVQQHIAQIPKQ